MSDEGTAPGAEPGTLQNVVRLWCIDKRNADECAVYAGGETETPSIGEEIWWQGSTIYWAGDQKKCRKVAYSFDPRELTKGGE
jgi:hypothetical protein